MRLYIVKGLLNGIKSELGDRYKFTSEQILGIFVKLISIELSNI